MLAVQERPASQLKPVVNNFTFQAATINGTGSQSSNLVITRALFAMGIPVAPKNVFPSNIEGLPTWFNIRISPEGYQCLAGAADVLLALNPATWQRDVLGVRSGGAVIHEANYPVAGPTKRDDISYYAVPFHKLGRDNIDNADLRKYLSNMIYVGSVAWALEIPLDEIEGALRQQFKRKPSAVELNMTSVRLGWDYCVEHYTKTDPFRVRPMSGRVEGKMLLEGNQALALGVLMGGCTVAAWYPITPSSSVCEYLETFANRYRVDPKTGEKRMAIIQAEDELAAVGIAVGAGWAGARAMTSTSGPGISLMAEFTGLAYFAEIPLVICDVQRMGPSTGLPTRTAQGDISFAHTLSHGDTKHPLLLPATVEEAYEFGQAAFDLAERLQGPVFVMSDLDLGMNLWMSDPFKYPETPYDRGKVLTAEDLERLKGDWGRYRDVDGDGIPFRTLPGTNHPAAAYFTRGTGHDEDARYSELPEVWERVLERIGKKYETARDLVPPAIVEDHGHDVAILAYGTSHHAVVEARDAMAARGLETDYIRVRALPFTEDALRFVRSHKRVYVVDQNRDRQLFSILRLELKPEEDHLISVRHFDGTPISAVAVMGPILVAEGKASADEFTQAPPVPVVTAGIE
ncbi:MAG TPA: 2-oxoacid:acceptor oxidoreductase subunit alpha [Chloroflexota bacterium]|nr:2-oxoacid:acceptor oxidoreductase subunit alpha [Chloroflexota bacterium]